MNAASLFPCRHLARRLAGLLFALVFSTAAGAAEKLSICHGGPAFALIPLAGLLGYYADQGLAVETRNFPSGAQALRAMFAGGCTLATASGTATTQHALERKDFRILALMASGHNHERIVARRDRGIGRPADLRGRRVAVPEGTSAHYFLDAFLAAHGVPARDVTKIFLPAQDVSAALLRGEVDAAAHWGANVVNMVQSLGDKAMVLETPALVASPFLLLGRDDFIKTHAVELTGVMRALARAEDFVRTKPDQAKSLLRAYYRISPQEMDAAWKDQTIQLSLPQSLMSNLESTARWQIGQRPPGERPSLPDLLLFIHSAALRAVKPAAVTVIE